MSMNGPVYLRRYGEPAWNRKEMLRYAGVHGKAPDLDPLLDACLDEVREKLVYQVCYREFPVISAGDQLDLGFTKSASVALKRNLAGCDHMVLFAATVGIELDRLIARYAAVSPTKALLLQAIGAERIESLCEEFSREIQSEKEAEGYRVRPRFSSGYGDFPLETQREIFAVLDCPRKIGVTLNESLLMSPSKSVTAIIGVGK